MPGRWTATRTLTTTISHDGPPANQVAKTELCLYLAEILEFERMVNKISTGESSSETRTTIALKILLRSTDLILPDSLLSSLPSFPALISGRKVLQVLFFTLVV